MKPSLRPLFAIQFSEGKALGEFCMLLREEEVPFHLGGFKTVVVPMDPGTMVKSLPERSRDFVTSHHPTIVPAKRDEKRPKLLSATEAEDVLRQLVKKR